MIDTGNYVRFERVGVVRQTDSGLLAELHGELLRLDVVHDDVVRVKISRRRIFDEAPTFAICGDPMSDRVPFSVERSVGVVRLRTSALVVSLWLDPFRLDVHRADGSPVVETAEDSVGEYWTYATLNDSFVVRRRCQPEDAIYGLGEKTGGLNRKGRDFTMWNTDVLDPVASNEFTANRPTGDARADRTSTEFDPYYLAIPLFYHQTYPAGAIAASFVDNGYRGHYDFRDPCWYLFHFSGGQYTEYIFSGPDMAHILSQYTGLTGRLAPPPLWALGYHQCRWFDYTQKAIEELAERHRALAVPCDSLWLDIEYMDAYRVFTWNKGAFPAVGGMLQRLSDEGFRLVTIIDPGVKAEPGFWVFDEALERDVLCRTEGGDVYLGEAWPGRVAFPDFVTEGARAWWGELNAAHVEGGVAGIWNDMNEPATGAISPATMRFGQGEHSHERYHNQYALLMAMGTTTGLLAAMPDRRTFVLTRAGFAGIQRYAANWLGDNLSRWDHLWLSMPMAMGLGMCGQSFVGADIGGFHGNATGELFLRWMQQGTLTPFCRNHSEIGNVEQYAWTFGDVILGLVREAIRLRYRLMPYLYACFLASAETGAPVQRPLVFDYQYDRLVWNIDDEFLLGSDLLVAPVTSAGSTARQVYIPQGSWYDWHTGEPVGGNRYLTAPTPMDRIPMYVRGGAVIPMWPEAPASTDGYHPSVVELHLFIPESDGMHRSLLQEDDGLTFAASRGARVRTNFEVGRTGDRLSLRATVEGDGYPEFARESFHLTVHGARPSAARLDGRELRTVGDHFVLPNAGAGFLLEFAIE